MGKSTDWPDTIPLTPGIARDVIDEVDRQLPEGWQLMPIGGTYVGLAGFDQGADTTKGIDLVATARVDNEAKIPAYEAVLAFAHGHSHHVQGRKDHTSVKFVLSTAHGPAEAEIIRGRAIGQGGYFVSRSILEEVLSLSEERNGLLWPPIEALAFLKAWAAHDKQKLIDAGKDARGYHAERNEAFLHDVRMLLDDLLDEGRQPEAAVFEQLFNRTGGEREKAVRKILVRLGWLQQSPG